MVSNKSNKKAKKPVETTLGKAPSNPKEKEIDPSHLRKPIDTSICGIKQVLSLLENATNEVKNFVMYECDIMYECRTCRSIFRSMANFILHKRNYCREKINPLDYINNNDTYQENVCMSEEKSISSKEDNKSLNRVIKKLQELEHVREVAKKVLTKDLSSEPHNQKLRSMDDRDEQSSNFNEILLERIDTNSSGMFQTLVGKSNYDCSAANSNKSTKLEVMEIHKILENDVPVLNPEGKIAGFTSNKLHQTSIFPKSEFNCVECNHRFSSQKSLTNHIKCVHNPSRIVYVCPTCKDTFANPWCVYRHLLKVHRMTNKQVRRLREQVHNSWIRRGEESSIQKKKPPEVSQGETNSENQWINDIEGDNDFQMCAGCGKHFERKAALHSHSQMCAKRLEVCNSIKENAKKKEEEEAIEKAKLEKTGSEKPLLRGASKRKGQSIWSYQRKPKDITEMVKEQFNSPEDENTLSLHSTEIIKEITNNDIFNVIPNMLTPKPSPSKDENNAALSPIINKIIRQKQIDQLEKHDDLKMIKSIPNKENSTHDMHNQNSPEIEDSEPNVMTKEVARATEESPDASELSIGNNCSHTTPVDMSIIKIEHNIEDDKDVNSASSDVENTVLIINTKSEGNSRPPSNVSVRSSKSVSFTKSVESYVEDNPRPLSEPFVKHRGTVSSATFEKLLWEDCSLGRANACVKSEISVSNTKLEKCPSEENIEARSKVFTECRKVVSNMKSEQSSSEENSQPRINSFPKTRNSVCIVSDNNESQEDNSDTLLQDNHDLLSSAVTFEMFCKKVAKVGRTSESSKKLDTNKRSPRMLRKRRKLTVSIEQSSQLNANVHKNPESDDDVIFVGETLEKNNKSNDTSLGLENGFAGFSHEETGHVSYSIDLSNLSYNNPLKHKQKDSQNETMNVTEENTALPRRKPMKRKTRGQSIDNKETISKHEKNEFNFILRATPYMNQSKLLCIPCGLTFKSFNLLLWHMSAHFSWFRFQCSKCSFITFNKYDCMLHARKQHKLKENSAANFILPLPNWKTVLMSHEFRLLKDCNDLKGKHTDEKIGIDESQDQNTEDNNEILESDAILFGESSKSSEESTRIVIEKENVKKRNKSGKTVIDIQETIKDFQKLPEPVELAMPAHVSEVIRTFSFDENTLSPDEAVTTFDNCGDESNDDWGLPKESEYGVPLETNIIMIKKEDDTNEKVKDESIASNIRPSRIRTKAKQNDDFVYYDNDINNVLKSTDFFKSSSQKQRTDSVITIKPKISGKLVPTTQKKKV